MTNFMIYPHDIFEYRNHMLTFASSEQKFIPQIKVVCHYCGNFVNMIFFLSSFTDRIDACREIHGWF